jgi:hypothetical protein
MSRPLIGFIIAPATPGLFIIILGIFGNSRVAEGIWWLGLILPISYAISAVVGCPIHLFLKRFKLRSIFYYFLAGVLASGIPILVLIIRPWSSDASSQDFSSLRIVMGMMVGASIMVSITFWTIVRPDRNFLEFGTHNIE